MSIKETKASATLLLGAPGSGKTTSIISYLEAGLEVFVLITDPGGEEALLDEVIKRKLPLEKLHWHYIPAGKVSWDIAERALSMTNSMNQKSLAGLSHGIEKGSFRQLLEVIEALADFPCDRTGETYGPADEWGADRALVIDSITGINKMAKRLTVGAKPVLSQGDWQIAMDAVETFLDILVGNTKCFLCCIAHIERQINEVTGRPTITASFLGKKLAPKIPGMFSDVVLAVKEGKKFRWSTIFEGVDLKARTLPLSDEIEPSFVQIVEGWRTREKAIASLMKGGEPDALTDS